MPAPMAASVTALPASMSVTGRSRADDTPVIAPATPAIGRASAADAAPRLTTSGAAVPASFADVPALSARPA